jgi:hypothetical protein
VVEIHPSPLIARLTTENAGHEKLPDHGIRIQRGECLEIPLLEAAEKEA